MKLTSLFRKIFDSEQTGGIILLICTMVSIAVANTSFGESYHHFWQYRIAGYSIEHWINHGFMAVFFLLIGLELEREIYEGELSNLKGALLPIFAALGGMLIPAGFYMLVNAGSVTQSGAGIPMATDIAFALGIISLLGKRVPLSLKIFLTALAVIDDLGAILVIAVFYSQSLVWTNLLIALGIFGVLLIFNRLNIKKLIPYIAGGLIMWYFMEHSGIHSTVTGVLLAFAIPFRKEGEKSPSFKMYHWIEKPVAFLVLPVFALANTAIIFGTGATEIFRQDYTLGIALGLIAGKPLGVFIFSYLAVILGISELSGELNWKTIAGAGLLTGIGFTMSIFITLLAFEDITMINNAKLMILISSLISGIAGYTMLKLVLKKSVSPG